jgi:CRP-like cAMP-binding protein
MDPANLRAISLFHNLSNDEIAGFAAILIPWEVGAGCQILAEGQTVTHLYLIDDGIVQMRRMAQGREMLLGRLSAGAFFGEVNLLDAGPASASMWAMKPTKMAVVDFETIRTFLDNFPGIGFKILRVVAAELAKGLRKTNERIVNVVSWN